MQSLNSGKREELLRKVHNSGQAIKAIGASTSAYAFALALENVLNSSSAEEEKIYLPLKFISFALPIMNEIDQRVNQQRGGISSMPAIDDLAPEHLDKRKISAKVSGTMHQQANRSPLEKTRDELNLLLELVLQSPLVSVSAEPPQRSITSRQNGLTQARR